MRPESATRRDSQSLLWTNSANRDFDSRFNVHHCFPKCSVFVRDRRVGMGRDRLWRCGWGDENIGVHNNTVECKPCESHLTTRIFSKIIPLCCFSSSVFSLFSVHGTPLHADSTRASEAMGDRCERIAALVAGPSGNRDKFLRNKMLAV